MDTIPEMISEHPLNLDETLRLTLSAVLDDTKVADLAGDGTTPIRIYADGDRMWMNITGSRPVEYMEEMELRMSMTEPAINPAAMRAIPEEKHVQWAGMMAWVAKCIPLSRFPACERTPLGEYLITAAAKVIWSDEISLLMTRPEFRKISMFEGGGSVRIRISIKAVI